MEIEIISPGGPSVNVWNSMELKSRLVSPTSLGGASTYLQGIRFIPRANKEDDPRKSVHTLKIGKSAAAQRRIIEYGNNTTVNEL